MAPLAELASCWPPALVKSASMVLCLRIEASVDEVFHTTWVDPTLSVAHHKSRGDTGLRETAWVVSKAALDGCTWHEPGDPAKDKAPIATHRYRKVRFESAPSALASKPFENTEVIQCNIYSPGKQYVLEAITSTTAPYGDKFTIYIRTILTAESRSRCTLYITHAVDWDPSMNFMLKPMVAKGMDVGLRGAFKTLRQMLQDYHSCTDITEQDWEQSRQAAQATNFMHTNIDELVEDEVVNGEVEAATAAASVPVPAQAAQPQAVSPHPPNLLSFMSEQLVYKDQVALLADVVGAGMRSIADQGLVARVLSVVLTLSLVSACVTVFKAIQNLCLAGGPLLAPVCYPLTHIIDVPDSTLEVLTTLALVALINYGIMKVSELSVVYLNKVNGSAPQQPDQLHATAAANGQPQSLPAQPSGGKLPSPASAKAAAASPTPAAAGAAAAAGVVAGVAVAAATAKGSGAPGVASNSAAAGNDQPPASTSASAAKPAAAIKGAKPEAPTAAAGAAKTVKPPPAPVVVKSNSSSPLRGSKVPGSGRRPSGSEPQVLEMQCLSPTEERGRATAAAGAGGAADAGASQKLQRVSTTGTGAGNAGAAAAAATAVQKSNASAPGGAAGTMAGRTAGASDDGQSASPHGKTMESERSWLDSMTDTFKGAWSKSQEPFNTLYGVSPEAVEYGLMVTTAQPNPEEGHYQASLAKSRSVTDIAATGASSKPSLVPGSPPAADRADLTSVSMPAMVMDTPGLEEEEPDVVEEEVFENERFQPFRLWGHTWPGHFLPSDRVAHWSDRKETPFGPAAMVFEQVAPKLPNDGWRWVEDKWSIDMEGVDVDAVDADGWYYALDFNYLRRHGAGFQVAGSGKCSTHHFVRRRRWVRVRARIGMDASSPVPIAQTFSKDAAPDDFDRGGASTQRLQLRTSSDDAGVCRALTVGTGTRGSGGGGHAREPSFSANGASSVSVPCSPTQAAAEDALGGSSTAVPKLATSWSALQAPTSSLMDRLEGVSPPLVAPAPTLSARTNPAAAAALQGSAGAVTSAVPQQPPIATPGASGTPAPSTSAIAGAAPSLDRTSNDSGRRNLSADEGSVYTDKGSSSNGATAAMMVAAAAAATAAAATAQPPSATPSTSPKAAPVTPPSPGLSPAPASGSARPHVLPAGASGTAASMPAPVPVSAAAPSQGSRPATAGQAKQATGFAAHAQTGQAPASIALNALSLLEDLQSTGSLAFMGDQAGVGEAPSPEGWSGSDFAADFSFSKLSLARERLAEGDLAVESQLAGDSVTSSNSRVRSLQEAGLPSNQRITAPEPQSISKEEVLHDPLGAENQ